MSIAQAFASYRQGKLADAEAVCTRILAAAPEDFDALHLLGLLRHQQKRNVEALQLVGAVLKRAPHSAEVLNNCGLILAALARHEEALAHFDRALASSAGYLHALKNRAAALKSLSRYEEALAAYAAVLAVKPDELDALNECGGLHLRLGRPAAAIACYDRALAAAPRLVELNINRATALAAMRRFDDALQSLAAAIAIQPDCAVAHYRASLIHLRLGDFKKGWRGFEWRLRSERAPKMRQVDAPLWLGDRPLEGKTILLLSEQGFGDTIQFLRYASLVAALGATVMLDVPRELKTLAATVPGVAAVFDHSEPTPPVDFYSPLLSLPRAFQSDLATVPANIPYLRPSDERLKRWRERVPRNGRRKIGICWAGSNAHLNDHNRSIALDRFARVLAVPNLDFVSLQRETGDAQAAILRNHHVIAFGRELRDFADTAAALATLDLVISVDTSVAHLAGAMGKGVALLLPFAPDWRWMDDRSDSPWYPTMRLFRQPTMGDWDSVLERLCQELGAVAARPTRSG
jgi:tetratricopeptide (TPR) repeat protein